MSDARSKIVVFDEALIEEKNYWLKRLARVSEPGGLRLDYQRLGSDPGKKATIDLKFNPQICRSLSELTGGGDFLLLATLMTALKICLYKYTGETVVVVGTPAPGHRAGSARWNNALAILDELDGRNTFRQLLMVVRQTLLDAYARQRYPFDRLLDDLGHAGITNRCPLFQVAIELTNLDCGTPELKNDLTLKFTKEGSLLHGRIEYNQSLFKVSAVEQFGSRLLNLLDQALTNANAPIGDLQLMSKPERNRILYDWNDTAREYPDELCLHQLFERQADRAPEAIALVFEGSSVSYHELNERANRLARRLQQLGVKPEVKVGILMDRSPQMIVATLAVNKAGGAYVPLDTSWPAERIQWILSSLDVSCLIAQQAHLRIAHDLQWSLPNLNDVICVDVEDPEPPPEQYGSVESLSIWGHLAEISVDRVSAAGFTSSYTGEAFTEAEVDVYVRRVVELAERSAGHLSRVLEIGCGTGLIMFELAPKVRSYVGLDQSEAAQARNRGHLERNGVSNVELVTGYANEIDCLTAGSFDLIIMASVAQFFPGPIYFEQVIKKALAILAPGGAILLADIMDGRRKQEFKQSLAEYKAQRPEARTKTDLSNDLYFDEQYFFNLKDALPGIARVKVLRRDQVFDNELRFRYDVIIEKAASDEVQQIPEIRERAKRLWTGWHVRNEPANPLPTSVTSENVAYIIFTSGSTGVPKGVVITHKAVINTIEWVNRTFEIGPADRLLFVTSLCFDLSVYDIFGVLGAGATIHIASKADLRAPERLAQMLISEKITFWDSAPASLQQLTSFFPSLKSDGGEPQLRLVFLSGDWIPLSLPGQITEVFPEARVIGLGGATEASIWSNYFPITEIKPDWLSVPYGKPIQNSRYHIFDSSLNPCPIGMSGDLFIGGACLASGYTDPAQTADRFVPDPFSTTPGSYLYRTGDRAKYWDDGNIEFLGRLDHQVKIRGYRIETGEIESALGPHPAVKQCLVVAREDEPGDKRLVAYLIYEERAEVGAGELRSFLRVKLPEYMLPSAFVALDAWPLSSNGKVDRKALPPPDHTRPDVGHIYAGPRTDTEQKLADIWSEILGIEKPGVEDNFFDLGGHSLLATRALSRIAQVFHVNMTLRSFFEMPTISSFAQGIDAQPREEPTAAPGLSHQSVSEAPLSYAQNQVWIAEQMESGTPTFNIPFAVRLSGALDIAALKKSLGHIIARHDILRTTFVVEGRGLIQSIALRQDAKLPVVDLSELDEAEKEATARRTVAEESRRTFDLGKGPLMRATLLKLRKGEHVVLFAMHHMISDGWSIGVLIRELVAFYKEEVGGERSELKGLPIQYADFARWQRQWLQGERLENMFNYWERQLAGAPPVLRIVSGAGNPNGKGGGRSAQVARLMPTTLAERLRELSKQEGATIFMTLLSSFQLLLHYHSGQTDIVIGTDIANRNQVETEQLIGLFVNQIALRADLSGNPTWRDLLAQTRRVTLDAYANQDLPFDKLVERLKPERVEGRTPIFQVKLALQNAPSSTLELPGLKIEMMGGDAGAIKFDLLLNITEAKSGLLTQLAFNPRIYNDRWATRLLEQFELVLAEAALHPDRGLKEFIGLLADSDRRLEARDKQLLQQARQTSLNRIRRNLTGRSENPAQN